MRFGFIHFSSPGHGGDYSGFPGISGFGSAFFLHDAGYICKRNMDGFEGEQHVVLGGRIMGWLFGPEWRDFTLCHSRHWAKRVGKRYSKLCLADKLAFVLTPAWLYLPMARLSGELQEYMRVASGRQLCGSITDFEQSLLDSRDSARVAGRAEDLHAPLGRATSQWHSRPLDSSALAATARKCHPSPRLNAT